MCTICFINSSHFIFSTNILFYKTDPKEMAEYQRGDDKQENQWSAKTIKKPEYKWMDFQI